MRTLFSISLFMLSVTARTQYITLDVDYAAGTGIASPVFFGSSMNSESLAMVVDANNNSYHVGYCESPDGFELGCAKLTPTGMPDGSFSGNGTSVTDAGYGIENLVSADLYSNGNMLLCGSFYDSNFGNFGGLVYRLTASGDLDATFNNDQSVFFLQSGESTWNFKAIGCAVLNNGSAFAAFSYEYDDGLHVVIVRFNSSGDFDESFGDAGYQLVVVSNYMEMAEFKDDGSNLFLCGMIEGFDDIDGVVIKLNASGNFSPGFGNGETAIAEGMNAIYTYPQSMCFDEDGNIYVTGISYSGGTFISKLDASGDLVTSFGTNGMVSYNGATDPASYDIERTPAGNLIVAGSETVDGNERSFIARFTSSGVLDTEFGNNGKYSPDFGTDIHAINEIHVLDDGSLLTSGYGAGTKSPNRFVCAKFQVTETGVADMLYGEPDIFPNPVNDKVFVRCNKTTLESIRVTDALGCVVKEIKMTAPQMQIDLADLPTGQYFFRAMDINGNFWTKVVVKT